MKLSASDAHYVNAAQGWIELGNLAEANEELENIPAQHRAHPDVLEIRCKIYMAAQKWDAAVDIANAVILADMSRVNAWLNRSAALHVLNRTQEAYDHLDTAVDLFPGHWRVQYDLARYACRLGKKREAWRLLSDAIELGENQKTIKVMGLDDTDLELLWREIGNCNLGS